MDLLKFRFFVNFVSLLRAIQLKKKLDEVEMKKRTSHSQLTATTVSLQSPIQNNPSLSSSPPPPLSLPPALFKTTPTNKTQPPPPPLDVNTSSNNSNTEVAMETPDLMGEDPDSDLELSPKSFD